MQLRFFLPTILVMLFFFTQMNAFAQKEMNQKHLEVALRMIGHRLLLVAGDSTSRVLPIHSEGNVYTLSFEHDFVMQPENLILIASDELRKADVTKGYIVEVKNCANDAIVYSYEKGNVSEEDLLPCQSRILPIDCYTIEFTMQGLKHLQNEDLVVQENQSNILFYIILIGSLIVGAFGFIWWKRKLPVEDTVDPSVIMIGQYQFNFISSTLTFNQQVEELTGKESELLQLLIDHKNETIERDVILQKVWGDEGDYIGRTLDVFISKLRKRLEEDASIKISNIRGVGYKLIIE